MKCKRNRLSLKASRKTSRTTATTDPTTCRRTSRNCRKSSRAISRLVPRLVMGLVGRRRTASLAIARLVARPDARLEKLQECPATTLIVRLHPRMVITLVLRPCKTYPRLIKVAGRSQRILNSDRIPCHDYYIRSRDYRGPQRLVSRLVLWSPTLARFFWSYVGLT